MQAHELNGSPLFCWGGDEREREVGEESRVLSLCRLEMKEGNGEGYVFGYYKGSMRNNNGLEQLSSGSTHHYCVSQMISLVIGRLEVAAISLSSASLGLRT